MGKKRYRKHSWKRHITTKEDALWSLGTKVFKCHRCGTTAWISEDSLRKIKKPKYRYFPNPKVQKFQEYRRKLNTHLNEWVAINVSPSSVDCDMIPVAEVMES